jgi:COMPASS component SWD3
MGGAFGTYGAADATFSFIASGSEDGGIWLWDVGTKTVLQNLENAHEGVVFSVDAHPERSWLVSGGTDRTVRLWRHSSPLPQSNTD